MKQEKEYDSRLAELTAGWFRLAKALDVYLQYEFTGATTAPGQAGVLEAVDALVTRSIRLSGAAEEREDRWLELTVDRQPERVRLVCASPGVCPVELAPLTGAGASVTLSQLSDLYQVTVDWYVRPGERGVDGPC